MSDRSSSYGLSFLDPSTVADRNGQTLDTSTPVNSNNNTNDETKLSPIEISESRTPTDRSRESKRQLHSILKNSPNKTFANSSYFSMSQNSRVALLTPSGRTKVLFSPTKEVVSFGNEPEKDYTVDLTRLEEELEKKVHPPSIGFWARVLTDPTIPYVLLLYLQLFFNLLLVSVLLYLVYVFITTIKADINQKIEIYTTDATREISRCTRDYYRNKCSTENGNTRAPALEQPCTVWEKCMNRDPQLIGKSKITAETFADIVNGFLRPISWKSLILVNIMIFGSLFVTNIAFGSYRSGSGHQAYSDRQRIKELEEKLKEKGKPEPRSQERLDPRMVTPPHFQTQDYIMNDSIVSYNSPLMGKVRHR